MIFIVLINKKEKELLSERFPKLTFVRTMKQDSKRGHYYCTEERAAMRMLNEIRTKDIVEEHPVRERKSEYKANKQRKK